MFIDILDKKVITMEKQTIKKLIDKLKNDIVADSVLIMLIAYIILIMIILYLKITL